MTTKHTPGPYFIADSGPAYRQVRPVAEPAYVVAIVPANIGMSDEEIAANARLFSVAPDLLQACQDAYEQIHGLIRRLSDAGLYGLSDDLWPGKNPTTLTRLKEAIVAATGEPL